MAITAENLEDNQNLLIAACFKSVKDLVKAGFKKNKSDLEALFANHVVELDYRDPDTNKSISIICTGNLRLRALYESKTAIDKKKAVKVPFIGMHTNESFNVRVYDLIECKPKTLVINKIDLRRGIVIQLSEANAEVLNICLTESLKKSKDLAKLQKTATKQAEKRKNSDSATSKK